MIRTPKAVLSTVSAVCDRMMYSASIVVQDTDLSGFKVQVSIRNTGSHKPFMGGYTEAIGRWITVARAAMVNADE